MSPKTLSEIRDDEAKLHSESYEASGYVSDPTYSVSTDENKKKSFLDGFDSAIKALNQIGLEGARNFTLITTKFADVDYFCDSRNTKAIEATLRIYNRENKEPVVTELIEALPAIARIKHLESLLSESQADVIRLKNELDESERKRELYLKTINEERDIAKAEYFKADTKIASLQADEKVLKGALEFYGNPKNYAKGFSMFYDVISMDDCADYPHVTRDVKSTGGKLARSVLSKWKGG